MDHDADLLRRFVEGFAAFDGMRVGLDFELDGDIAVIVAAPFDHRGWTDWRPVPARLSPNALEEFYRHVPGRLTAL
jgi:hypothetical protein